MNETLDEPWVEPKYLPFMVTAVPTVPDVGERELIRGEDEELRLKVALIALSAVIFTSQILPFTEVQPFQDVKLEAGADLAVRVTTVSCAKESEQVVPQEMPGG